VGLYKDDGGDFRCTECEELKVYCTCDDDTCSECGEHINNCTCDCCGDCNQRVEDCTCKISMSFYSNDMIEMVRALLPKKHSIEFENVSTGRQMILIDGVSYRFDNFNPNSSLEDNATTLANELIELGSKGKQIRPGVYV
jgi:hypothetical protein